MHSFSSAFRKFLVLLLLIGTTLMVACTQSKISVLTKFSEQEYAEDLDSLAALLSDNHPAYDRFKSSLEISEIVEELKGELTDKTTVGEFVWKCRTLMASIGCGHTYMPSQGARLLLPERLRFPIKVLVISDKLVVVDPLESTVSKGDTILAVNGVEVESILNRFVKRVSADGYNSGFISSLINEGIDDYFAFEMGFPVSYEVETRSGLHKLPTTADPLIPPSVLPSCPQKLCFEILKDVGIMTIRNFEFYNKRLPEFTDFIDETMTELHDNKVQNLIIDIRGNGGGDPYCSSHLIKSISGKTIQYYHESVLGYDDLKKPIPGFSKHFAGNVYILSNGKNFSTSGHFLSLVREHDLGLIAGTESGATYSCNARQMSFTLQNTGLSGSIARSIYKTQVAEMPLDRGITPDLVIPPTQESLLLNKDEQLEEVIRYIEKNGE